MKNVLIGTFLRRAGAAEILGPIPGLSINDPLLAAVLDFDTPSCCCMRARRMAKDPPGTQQETG